MPLPHLKVSFGINLVFRSVVVPLIVSVRKSWPLIVSVRKPWPLVVSVRKSWPLVVSVRKSWPRALSGKKKVCYFSDWLNAD